MKRAFAILGVLFLLSGCAIINSLVQPDSYKAGTGFKITVHATNYNDSEAWQSAMIPSIHLCLPENWELMGCTGSGLEDLKQAKAPPADLRNHPLITANYIASPPENGYEEQAFYFEPVKMEFGQPFTIECSIRPTTCGDYELTYSVMTWPEIFSSSGAASDELVKDDLPEWLEDIFVSQAISCERQAVPTVSQWGMMVLALLLVGSAIRFIWVRKRQA